MHHILKNEISSKFLTRSGYENSIQSSLTENQMRLLGEILQMSEKKDFTFACAFDLVKRSELSEEEAQAMYGLLQLRLESLTHFKMRIL